MYFQIYFEIICSNSVKNTIGIMIEIALNLENALGNMAFLTVWILPEQEYSISFHLFVSSSVSFISVL